MISTLDFENACPGSTVPAEARFRVWVDAAVGATASLQQPGRPVNISIRVVDEQESAELNLGYRGKNYPTNVLSFSSDVPPTIAALLEEWPLGDLVICAPVVAREAQEQGKVAEHHWAHMVIHGVLHLSGLDHQEDQEAEHMESLETQILATLGIADPYQEDPISTSLSANPKEDRR